MPLVFCGMDASGQILQVLRSPGRGLLTVSTLGSRQIDLEKRYFKKYQNSWLAQVEARLLKNGPLILGVPSDAGAGICRGSNHGPQHIRAEIFSKKKKWADFDLGDIPCIPQLSHDEILSLQQKEKSGKSIWGESYNANLPVSPLNLLQSVLEKIWKEKAQQSLLILGGDHSISEPVVRALHQVGKLENLGILHFDAHTDLMENRYGLDHCFGTWAAHAVRLMKDPAAFVQVGIRSSGRDRNHWESKFGLRQIWSKELKKSNPKQWAESVAQSWKSRGIEKIYVSFDIDFLDEKVAPSTGTPEAHGPSLKWTKEFLACVAEEFEIVSADIVEVAPVLGSRAEISKTVRAASAIAEILLNAMKP